MNNEPNVGANAQSTWCIENKFKIKQCNELALLVSVVEVRIECFYIYMFVMNLWFLVSDQFFAKKDGRCTHCCCYWAPLTSFPPLQSSTPSLTQVDKELMDTKGARSPKCVTFSSKWRDGTCSGTVQSKHICRQPKEKRERKGKEREIANEQSSPFPAIKVFIRPTKNMQMNQRKNQNKTQTCFVIIHHSFSSSFSFCPSLEKKA